MQEMQGQITNALLTDRGDIAKNTLPIEVMSEIIRGIDPGRPDEEARRAAPRRAASPPLPARARARACAS